MDRWVILGKPECRWCKEAMQLLHERNIEFYYMDILNAEGLYQFMLYSGLMTVPQVFKNGHLIGGYEDLERYLSGGDGIEEVA